MCCGAAVTNIFTSTAPAPAHFNSQVEAQAPPPRHTMAAFISSINAKIRSQPVLNYICSTREYFSVYCLYNPSPQSQAFTGRSVGAPKNPFDFLW